jgi:quinolinate synthase
MAPEQERSADLTSSVTALARKRGALIMAHSYQPAEIQDAADFVGDSLELCRAAASAPEEIIVLCGVRFMAETASVLAPRKLVIHPVPEAGCPLADSMTAADMRAMKAAFPAALPVVYVNSSMELKALSYACCTSANAVQAVESVPSGEVIFGPDRNLGVFVSRRTGKVVRVFPGGCPPHARADVSDLRTRIAEWPDAEVLVHPETPPEAWDLATAVLGTGGMIRHVGRSSATRFLIGTEGGFVHRLNKLFPDKQFLAVGRISCPNMKKITLESLSASLEDLEPVVTVEPTLARQALAAIERMVGIG